MDTALKIIRRMLDDEASRVRAFAVLTDAHFDKVPLYMFRCVKKLSLTCSGTITLDTLSTFINRQNLRERQRAILERTIGEMAASGSVAASEFDYAIEVLVSDVREDCLFAGLRKAADALSKKNVLFAEEILHKASIDNRRLAIETDRCISARTMGQLKADDETNRFQTGFLKLDEITGGGRPSEMWLWAAYLSEFKSMALLSVAHHNFLQGKNTLYVTMEMDTQEVQRRLICIHAAYLETPIEYREVEFANFNGTKHDYEEAVDDFDTNAEYGDIQVWQPPLGSTIHDVTRQLALCRSRRDTPILILDYLQLLAPVRKRGSAREELNDTLQQSKRLAMESNVWLVSGYQTSTEGRKKAEDEGFYSKWAMSETVEAGRIANVICWSLQTKEMLDDKEVKVGLAKSRNSTIAGSNHFLVADPSLGFMSREPTRGDVDFADEDVIDLEDFG